MGHLGQVAGQLDGDDFLGIDAPAVGAFEAPALRGLEALDVAVKGL
jgi:hypothetical protein